MSILALANNKLNQADELPPEGRTSRARSHPKKNLNSLFETAKPKLESKAVFKTESKPAPKLVSAKKKKIVQEIVRQKFNSKKEASGSIR